VITQLLAHGCVRRAWIGIAGSNAALARRIAHHHALTNSGGVRVQKVQANSPAAAAGIETGDLVVEYDGETVTSIDRLQRVLDHSRVGLATSVTVLRRGHLLALPIAATEQSASV